MFQKEKTNLEKNEIRVMRIGADAIREILFESILESAREKFDLPRNSKNHTFHMCISSTFDDLIVYACYMADNEIPDFGLIDKYVETNIDITTKSFYSPRNRCYKTIIMDSCE